MNLGTVKPSLERVIRDKRWSELQDQLLELPPLDIASLLVEVPDDQDAAIFRVLPKELASQVFTYLPLAHQGKFDSDTFQRTNAERPLGNDSRRSSGVAGRAADGDNSQACW